MFKNLEKTSEVFKVNPSDPQYNSLIPFRGQRPQIKDHLNKIKESITEVGSITEYNPIRVDEKGFIHDGQHTYIAHKELNLPFYIMEVPTNWQGMITLNTNQRNWKGWDFANYWDQKGKKPYRNFLNLASMYPFVSCGVLIAIFNKDSSRRACYAVDFRLGKLRKDTMAYAEMILTKLESLKNISKQPPLEAKTHSKQQFQQAMLQAFDNVEFSFLNFKRGLVDTEHELNRLAKQVDMLEEIYRLEKIGKIINDK